MAGGVEPAAPAHPAQGAQLGAGGGRPRGVEGVGAVYQGDEFASGGGAGQKRGEETAASRGPRADDLAVSWPRGNASSKEAMLSRPHPGGGKGSFAMAIG